MSKIYKFKGIKNSKQKKKNINKRPCIKRGYSTSATKISSNSNYNSLPPFLRKFTDLNSKNISLIRKLYKNKVIVYGIQNNISKRCARNLYR